jgi:hypothetical protein
MHQFRHRPAQPAPWPLPHQPRLALLCLALAAPLLLTNCAPKAKPAPPAAPAATYTGPAFLRGTVGSLAALRNHQPILVGGFGIVVNLNGTGSSEVPAFLRQWLINDMRKRGLGSPQHGTAELTPARVLADPNTAVVAVQGFIPPGATTGTRFDLVVSALPQTQTTSLAGGELWTVELAEGGTDPNLRFRFPKAQGAGPIYIEPQENQADQSDFRRHAVVVAGGTASEPRPLELVLNQPSWQRSRLISDRINERFGLTTDRWPIAQPQTDALIRLRIPDRFAKQPDLLLDLVAHLYLERGSDFEPQQARRLAEVLKADPNNSHHVMSAWRGLGRTILPVLREYYESPDLNLKLPALEAGAWLADERASGFLQHVAADPDPAIRQRAAQALVYLPRSLKGSQTLKALLDDPEPAVRIAAYESLAGINDAIIDRLAVPGQSGPKFIIDRVPADKPLIYVTQQDLPHLVIFGPDLGFQTPLLARMWDNHLMLKAELPNQPVTVFYQAPRETEPQVHQMIPTVATLAYLLAHRPTVEDPAQGFDLSYGQVVDALYDLCQTGAIPAPMQVKFSPLAHAIREYEKNTPAQQRPETAPSPLDPGLEPIDAGQTELSARPETLSPVP